MGWGVLLSIQKDWDHNMLVPLVLPVEEHPSSQSRRFHSDAMTLGSYQTSAYLEQTTT